MTTMRKRLSTLFSITVLILLLAACGDDKEAEPAAVASAPETNAVATTVVATTAPANAAPASEATAAPAPSEAAAQSPAAPQAAAPSDDPLQAVTNAMTAQLASGPYRATTSVEANDTITEMTAEVIPPDKMHIVIGGGNLELILINGTLWSKSGDAPWAQMGSPDMMQSIFDSIHGQMDASALSNVQYVGAEPVMGVATQVYSFTSTLGEGEGLVTSDVKLWINKENGLPVRMEATGTGMGTTSHTVQSIEYDDTIAIEAPTH
jgi:hypothetical protein